MVKCPVCQSDDLKFITRKIRFEHEADVYICQGCSLTFIDQASFEYPKDFYEKEYHQTYITHVEPDALNPEVFYQKMCKAVKIWADKFGEMLTGTETVLDVGCSTGHFLDMIKDKAGAVYGNELNSKEIAFCRESLGLDVSDEPLEKRFGEETFDYITMIYVLEHIAAPVEFLEYLKRFLKPDGKIIIVVPNSSDALVNFYDIPEFREFYYCIEHLFYYNQETIRPLLEKAGLKGDVEVIQEYPLANHLNWAYRRAPSDTLAARLGMPDVKIRDEAMMESWAVLWDGFNKLYKEFLHEQGFGDRLWCVVGR